MRQSTGILERLRQADKPPSTQARAMKPMDLVTRDIIILGILMFIFIVNCVVGFVFLEEDAFIDFRYAVNLVDGNGFVFNTSEEPVEGYSNFLWLIILYIFHGAGSDLVATGRIIGIMLGIGTMYMSYLAVRDITKRNGMLNLLPPAMIAFSPPLIYWYQGGLEPALFSFLIMTLVHLHFRESEDIPRFPLSGIICFLLAITRPEGIIFFVLFIILKFRPAMKDDTKLRAYIMWFFLCFIPLLVFIAFRYATFHALLPNTYYAKVNYSHSEALRIGWIYTLGFFSDSRAWIWMLPFIGVLARVRGSDFWRNLLPLFIFGVYVLFVLYVGGDFHIYFRFFAPLLPLLFIMCTAGLWQIWEAVNSSGNVKFAKVFVFVLALLAIFVSSVYHRSPAWRDLNQVSPMDRSTLSYRYQELIKDPSQFNIRLNKWFKPPGDILAVTGKWLAEEYPPETRLATEQCGKVPYYTGFHTYDLLGLNDKETARIIHYKRSFDEYLQAFVAADADIVLLYYADDRFVDQLHIGRLVESREFQSAYEMVKVLDFEYVYSLDKQYKRPRRMLLFERRGEAVDIETPMKTSGMIETFLNPIETEEEETGETRETVVNFVVEL